jgi:hypothetical protein
VEALKTAQVKIRAVEPSTTRQQVSKRSDLRSFAIAEAQLMRE